MPKARSPNRNKAFELYEQSNGTIPLVEIANALGETDGTVRGWKSKDKWESKLNGTFQTNDTERSEKKKPNKKNSKKSSSSLYNEKSDVPIMGTNENRETNIKQKTRGAPKGNSNAKGNRGGKGAPPKNKYALATGEYETIIMNDIFSETELALINTETNVYVELDQELKYWSVREYRMLVRIKKLEDTKKELMVSSITTTDSETEGGNFTGTTKGKSTFLKNTLDEILRIEEALTRVQANKLKVLEKIHKFDMDHTRLKLEKKRIQLYENKLKGVISKEDIEDFLLEELEDLGELDI